jgi:hypothetical protein
MPNIQNRDRRVHWDNLPDDLQLELAAQALLRAAETIAGHAECLAAEMEGGALNDEGGPDALRLLAAVIRSTNRTDTGPANPRALRH